jgi:hypothetical protein
MYDLCSEKITFNNPQEVCKEIDSYERTLTSESVRLLKNFPLNPIKDDYLGYSDKVIQQFKHIVQPNHRVTAIAEYFKELYIEANEHYPGIIIESSHNLDHILSTAVIINTITKYANLDSCSVQFKDDLDREELIEFGLSAAILHDSAKAIIPGLEDGHGGASAGYSIKRLLDAGYSSKDVIKTTKAITTHETITASAKFQPTTFLDHALKISDKMDSIGYMNTYRWSIYKKEHKWNWGKLLELWRSSYPKIRRDLSVCPQLEYFVEKRIKETQLGLEKVVDMKEPLFGILYCELFI